MNPYASPQGVFPSEWRGWYSYDPMEHMTVVVPNVTFEMSLEFGWFGRFSGSVQDGPESNMNETGRVKGRIRKMKIDFTKYMPVEYIMNPDGTAAKSRERHPPIHYFGTLDDTSFQMTGQWYIIFGGETTSGRWKASPVGMPDG